MAGPPIPAHQHCEICSKVVAIDTRFCSEACDQKHDELLAEKKKSTYKFVAFLGLLALFFMAVRQGWI